MIVTILLGIIAVLWILGGYQMTGMLPLVEASAEEQGFSVEPETKVFMVVAWPYVMVREMFMKDEDDSGV